MNTNNTNNTNMFICSIDFKRFKNKSLILLFETIPFNYYISNLIMNIKNRKIQVVIKKYDKNKILYVENIKVKSDVHCLLKLNDKQIVAGLNNGEIILITLTRSLEFNKDKINKEVVVKLTSKISNLLCLVKLNEKQIISGGDNIIIWDIINLKASKIIKLGIDKFNDYIFSMIKT